jgi:hypothetical protein
MSDKPIQRPTVRLVPANGPDREARLVRAIAILIEAAKAMQGKKAA